MADDIDAALDGALGVEGEALAAGYAEGRTRGATSGRDDGWRLGFGRGRELGQELGRIWGRVLMLQASIATQPQRCPDRVRRVLAEVRELISEEPPHPLDEARFDAIGDVRAKMRMIDAWLGGSRPPASEPSLSF